VKISLVATVKDAGQHVGDFLESVRAQTRPPDEVVIVDGGSTEGTLETLRSAPDVTLIEAPGANIASGRNAAVRAAAHDVIAVTDADCVLGPDWLAHLERAVEDGADVAMGFYRSLMAVADAARMAGYVAGLGRRILGGEQHGRARLGGPTR
jgi:glycosyltransferase involved in cell wall biosynthesis